MSFFFRLAIYIECEPGKILDTFVLFYTGIYFGFQIKHYRNKKLDNSLNKLIFKLTYMKLNQ